MPLADTLLPEFDHEMTTTRKLLERVPDERLRLEAAREVVCRSGQLAQHVATIPMVGHDDAERSGVRPRRSAPSSPLQTRADAARPLRRHARERARGAGRQDRR